MIIYLNIISDSSHRIGKVIIAALTGWNNFNVAIWLSSHTHVPGTASTDSSLRLKDPINAVLCIFARKGLLKKKHFPRSSFSLCSVVSKLIWRLFRSKRLLFLFCEYYCLRTKSENNVYVQLSSTKIKSEKKDGRTSSSTRFPGASRE